MAFLSKKNFASADELKTIEEIVNIINSLNFTMSAIKNYGDQNCFSYLDKLFESLGTEVHLFTKIKSKLNLPELLPQLRNYLNIKSIMLTREWLQGELNNTIIPAINSAKVDNLSEKEIIENSKKMYILHQKINKNINLITLVTTHFEKLLSKIDLEQIRYKNLKDDFMTAKKNLTKKTAKFESFLLQLKSVQQENNELSQKRENISEKSAELIALLPETKKPEKMKTFAALLEKYCQIVYKDFYAVCLNKIHQLVIENSDSEDKQQSSLQLGKVARFLIEESTVIFEIDRLLNLIKEKQKELDLFGISFEKDHIKKLQNRLYDFRNLHDQTDNLAIGIYNSYFLP